MHYDQHPCIYIYIYTHHMYACLCMYLCYKYIRTKPPIRHDDVEPRSIAVGPLNVLCLDWWKHGTRTGTFPLSKIRSLVIFTGTNLHPALFTSYYRYSILQSFRTEAPRFPEGQGHWTKQSPQICSPTGRLGRRAPENGGENPEPGPEICQCLRPLLLEGY